MKTSVILYSTCCLIGFEPMVTLVLDFNSDIARHKAYFNRCSNWKFLDNHEDLTRQPQTFRERYWLGLEDQKSDSVHSTHPLQTAEKGWAFLRQLQMEDGSWGSNCDGPMFITSGIVFAMYVVGIPIETALKLEMCRYLINTSNEDGGWGVYLDGPSTVFGTAINYVMLRILGLPSDHHACKMSRNLLLRMGGAVGIPTWGRFWLCVMNLYEWDGIAPLPAELLLTPRYFPLNPANWWMPLRNIYMGMSYLYGHRFRTPENDLIRTIRAEIYTSPYDEIDWPSQHNNINPIDLAKPKSYLQTGLVSVLRIYERWKIAALRDRGLSEALFQIESDVEATGYCSYSPAYWAVDIIALCHAHGPDSHWVHGMKAHFQDGLWMCREGLAASGTDGNAVWETSLSVQALCSSEMKLEDDDLQTLNMAVTFLDVSQLRHNPPQMDRTYRHPTKGGWPYSTHNQGYIVSDVTSETLIALLQAHRIPTVSKQITVERFQEAVDSLINLESSGGGFGAYEKTRGWEILELLNVTDTYEDCMIERRYAETTGSTMMALTEFTVEFPYYRTKDISRCMEGGAKYLLKSQYPHGGWIGTWGVCFTFATMFALQGLACIGESEQNSSAVEKACDFLLRHQNPDGGWGEALESYKAKDYVPEPEGSQVPNTAYAVIGLLAAQCSNQSAIKRGVVFLMKSQQSSGDWLPGSLEGIYTPPCGYRYPLYKFHFTLKALGMYTKRYGNTQLL